MGKGGRLAPASGLEKATSAARNENEMQLLGGHMLAFETT